MFVPNAFVRIAPDNSVTVIIKHVEMGQGTDTGLATILAEEIDANWIQVRAAVVENGMAHLRKIAITTDYGTEFEVNEGIKDRDQVILQPPVNLADGDKVQVVPEAPAAPDFSKLEHF